jgi:DNA-binding IscR family transcriptional regulator
MRLTTKGRFAVTAMIDLALHSADGPVTLAGISEGRKFPCLIWNNYSANCGATSWWAAFGDRAVVIA